MISIKNKNWIKIGSIYVGTVIGAGFSSGREIIDFFGVYGINGIWGIVISGILFSLLGSLLLLKIYNNKIIGFDDLMSRLFGEKFSFIIKIIISLALYTGFSIMLAGSGVIFKQELGISFNIGVVFMMVASFIVFLYSLEGLTFINTMLVPILIIGIIFTSFYLGGIRGYDFTGIESVRYTLKGNFLTSSFLYFGTNSLLIIVVFSSLLPLINNRKTAILGGISGGVILSILGISILTSMFIYYNEVSTLDIPMLSISNYISSNYRKLYAIVLWIAMFTTALANGFGFINRFNNKKNMGLKIGLFCLSTIPLTKFGFANLIAVIYPVFGVIGFAIILIVLLY